MQCNFARERSSLGFQATATYLDISMIMFQSLDKRQSFNKDDFEQFE